MKVKTTEPIKVETKILFVDGSNYTSVDYETFKQTIKRKFEEEDLLFFYDYSVDISTRTALPDKPEDEMEVYPDEYGVENHACMLFADEVKHMSAVNTVVFLPGWDKYEQNELKREICKVFKINYIIYDDLIKELEE